jgi:hypothetical protein
MNVSESGRQNVHLLVLIHGLWGELLHFAFRDVSVAPETRC